MVDKQKRKLKLLIAQIKQELLIIEKETELGLFQIEKNKNRLRIFKNVIK